MIVNLKNYIKNRRIGSTYPSIDTKPDSKAKKVLKKVGAYLFCKYIDAFNAIPFIHPRPAIGLINAIELQGMLCF